MEHGAPTAHRGRTGSKVFSYIAGVGMAVPDRVIPNGHFASYLDTSDEWIRERTGIEERRWAEPHESVGEFAERAARRALEHAQMSATTIDGIVFATVTPDFVFPSSACVLQGRLGIKRGFAFDVNAVCTGFIYALTIADSMIAAGQASNVLVVGAELFSRLVDPNDRTTCILFGDGAGAVVLSRVPDEWNAEDEEERDRSERPNGRGIYAAELCADGRYGDILCVPAGTARPVTPASLAAREHYLRMNGREVFKLAVRTLTEVSERVITRAGFTVDDVDLIISHQANKRILSAMGEYLRVDPKKVLSNVERYGNTSAASVPILLAEACEKGFVKQGDLVLLSAVGGGMTWGAVLLRW